jgi:hypothetical protein
LTDPARSFPLEQNPQFTKSLEGSQQSEFTS